MDYNLQFYNIKYLVNFLMTRKIIFSVECCIFAGFLQKKNTLYN